MHVATDSATDTAIMQQIQNPDTNQSDGDKVNWFVLFALQLVPWYRSYKLLVQMHEITDMNRRRDVVIVIIINIRHNIIYIIVLCWYLRCHCPEWYFYIRYVNNRLIGVSSQQWKVYSSLFSWHERDRIHLQCMVDAHDYLHVDQ